MGILSHSLNIFSQSFKGKLEESNLLNKKELINLIDSPIKFKKFRSTGDCIFGDSITLCVIEAYSKNDTIYHIGMVFRNNILETMYTLPHIYIIKSERVVIGRVYTEYEKNNCFKFVLNEISPVNISKMDHKFNFNEAVILESKEIVLCH